MLQFKMGKCIYLKSWGITNILYFKFYVQLTSSGIRKASRSTSILYIDNHTGLITDSHLLRSKFCRFLCCLHLFESKHHIYKRDNRCNCRNKYT